MPMTDEYRELCWRLRDGAKQVSGRASNDMRLAAQAIEALAGEVAGPRARRDDGTAIASGGEPGASAGASQ